jgi:hypothetical protein
MTEIDTTARENKERQPYLGPDEHAGGARSDASSRAIAGARHRRDDDPRRIGVLDIVIVASVASLFLFGPPGRRDQAATLAPVVAAQSGSSQAPSNILGRATGLARQTLDWILAVTGRRAL